MGALDDEVTKMMSDLPKLLEARYDHENFGDLTAAEFICVLDLNAGSRDMLCDLMVLGAKATDDCYSSFSLEGPTSDFYECLKMISGYMPLQWPFESCRGQFFS
jgi:hypothetical protein